MNLGRQIENTKYIGDELEVFAHANNWKHWWSSLCAPYIQGRILEIGAGSGINIAPLIQAVRIYTSNDPSTIITEWLALEPDESLCQQIQSQDSSLQHFALKSFNGYLNSLPKDLSNSFNTILYIDVLEHIKDDKEEIERAWSFLSDGGHLIILVPSRPELYSAFDKAIGHYRRYTPTTLKRCFPDKAKILQFEYLDFWGSFFPITNRILGSSKPNLAAIRAWDGFFIPLSKLTNFCTRKLYGKSLFCVISKSYRQSES